VKNADLLALASIWSTNSRGCHETITLAPHGYNLLGSRVFNFNLIYSAILFTWLRLLLEET